jgi:DNA primase
MSAVEEIKDRLDIVEVIQTYVPLKKAGRNYKGLCPFHAEKTPSFVVFPDTGTWHCFGACGTGGDVFTFIAKQENLDFGEALRVLAQRAGVELEPRSPQAAEAEQRLALLREINQAAAVYFHHLLSSSDEARRARNYLDGRGLNLETLDRFQVGYALDQWDGLLRYLTGKGYRLSDIAEAGLLIEREDKGGYYDRFRARVVFPIRDHRGRTIGFGGRVLDDGVPKYLNSPETPLFDKGSVLFGLDVARQGIRVTGKAVIVEGYMDVLMAHQCGINNVVAQMGTALTEQQLRRLKRYSQCLILALDSDLAGDRATLRGLDVAREVMNREIVPVPTPRGLIRFEDRLAADIRIVSLPAGRDPDEVIRESPTRWAQLIAGAKPVMDYYFEAFTADLDLLTAQGKSEAVRRLGPLLVELGDRVQRTHYLQHLARMVQMDERTLWQQVRKVAGRRRTSRAAQERQPAPEADRRSIPEGLSAEPQLRPLGLDEHCLSFVLHSPDLLVWADTMLQACREEPFGGEDLSRPDDRAILDAWREWLSNPSTKLRTGDSPADLRTVFYETLDERLQRRTDALIRERGREPQVAEDLLRDKVLDAIAELRLRNLKRQNFELSFLHRDAQASGDRETSREYGKLSNELIRRIRRLQKSLSERSISGRRQRDDVPVRIPPTQE